MAKGNSKISKSGNAVTVNYTREKGFDEELFGRLPKKLQVQNIVDIGKDKTIDGTRYRALVKFDDGFQRSIAEYSFGEFKNYLNDVLFKNRRIEY